MWDKRYDSEHYHYGLEPNDFLKQNTDQIPMGNVLCLAEGEGRNAVYLAKLGYQVTAVDSSIVGLKKAEALAQENSVTINCIHADLEHYDIGENQWDGIVSIFCHLPPKLRADVHQRVVKGLKPNGVILLELYSTEQLKHGTGGPQSLEMLVTKPMLIHELAGLNFSHCVEVERDVVEGEGHKGKGAVVQVIGKK